MTKIANLVRKCVTNRSLSNSLEKAKEAYGDTTFSQEHLETYNSIIQFGFLPSVISVASAALVFFYIIPNIHWGIAYAIGLLIASPYEKFKTWLSQKGFRAYFKGSKGFLLVAVVLVYLGSVAFSSFGAYQGYKLLERGNTGAIQSKNGQIRDSLTVAHDLAIKEAKEVAKNFHDSNLVKVKNANGQYVQVLSDRASVKNTYRDLVLSIESAKDEKRKALKEHDDNSPNEVAQAVADMGYYLIIVIALSVVNESIIFFSERFKEYYLYKSNIEQTVISQSEEFKLNFESLASLVQLAQLGTGMQTINAQNFLQGPTASSEEQDEESHIGFRQNGRQTPSNNNSPKNATKDNQTPFGFADCRNCGKRFEKSRKQHFYCSKDCNRAYHKISISK